MIHRVRIENFLGCALREVELGPDGALIEGGNARGKTTVLKAVQAALEARGVSKDAIRRGATSAEILISYDDITVRRAITQKGSSLDVRGEDGKKVSSPQTFLRDMLGLSGLDPLALFLEQDGKKRQKTILAAMPVAVTAEQLTGWAPGVDLPAILGRTSDGSADVTGHGLEVVAKVRGALYSQRTEANRTVATREKDVAARTAEHGAAREKGLALARDLGIGDSDPLPTVESAENGLAGARAGQAALFERERSVRAAADAQAKVTTRVAELRQRAVETKAQAEGAPTDEQIAAAQARVDSAVAEHDVAAKEVARLRVLLDEAEARVQRSRQNIDAMNGERAGLARRRDAAVDAVRRAADLAAQADELEATAKATAIQPPSDEEIASARAGVDRATRMVELARHVSDVIQAGNLLAQAEASLTAARAEAERLNTAVVALTDRAPSELLRSADAIQGLTVDGDDTYLDGVNLEQLSGSERMRFSIEIARRANAKSKLLLVDGLEQLDGERLREFVTHATKGGFQILATRVLTEGGDLRVTPLGQKAAT